MSTPDESGDEYDPVVSSWGDQPGANQNNAGGWDSLIDPTFKIQANGIGSGNLHRKGRNFIPVAEEEILRQRNKQPAPKSKKDKENKPAPKRASRKESSASKPGASKPPVKRNNPPSPAPPKKFGPTPSTTPAFSTLRPPPTGNSVWTSGTLVETPFWEQKDPAVAAPRLQHSNKQQMAQPTHNQRSVQQAQQPDVETQQKRVYNAAGSKPRSSFNDKPPVVIDEDVKGDREARLSAHPQNTRPPPGLFQSAISQIAGGACNPVRPRFSGTKAPPGLSPIPLNPLPTTPQPQHQQQQKRNIAPPGFQQHMPHIQSPRTQQQTDYGQTSNAANQVHLKRPDHNPVVIHINIELQAGGKVPVPLRLHDDPELVARDFIARHGITEPSLVQALLQLFVSQKEMAVKKRHM